MAPYMILTRLSFDALFFRNNNGSLVKSHLFTPGKQKNTYLFIFALITTGITCIRYIACSKKRSSKFVVLFNVAVGKATNAHVCVVGGCGWLFWLFVVVPVVIFPKRDA